MKFTFAKFGAILCTYIASTFQPTASEGQERPDWDTFQSACANSGSVAKLERRW
jgi:hypothetical protein